MRSRRLLPFASLLSVLLTLSAAANTNAFHFAPPSENFVYSPYGVESVLEMVKLGAKGETLSELEKVLPKPKKDAGAPGSVHGEGFRFTIANSAWVRRNYALIPSFTADLQAKFGAEITPLDFKDATADAGRINAWIDKNTQGKITKLIEPSAIHPDLQLVLVNALYFKAKWENPFKQAGTRADDFHPVRGKIFKADFMHQQRSYSVLRRKDSDLVVLPYAGHRQSLWLVLPHAGVPLDQLEPDLEETKLEKSYATDRNAAKATTVDLALPKFSVTSQFSVVPYLEKRGLHRIFKPETADLTGISAEKPLCVTEIIQRAVIELDEEGTEAAAATAMFLGAGAVFRDEKPLELKFDRPFAYFLRDEATGKILFMGRLARAPEAKIRH